jgi:hypothetical protein
VQLTAHASKRSAWEAWRLRRLSRTEAHPVLCRGISPSLFLVLVSASIHKIKVCCQETASGATSFLVQEDCTMVHGARGNDAERTRRREGTC